MQLVSNYGVLGVVESLEGISPTPMYMFIREDASKDMLEQDPSSRVGQQQEPSAATSYFSGGT